MCSNVAVRWWARLAAGKFGRVLFVFYRTCVYFEDVFELFAVIVMIFFFSSSSPFNSAEPSASLAAHLTAVWSFPKSRLPASCRLTHTKVQISLGRFSPESKLKTNQKRKIEVEDSVFSTFSKRTDIFPRPPGAVQSAEIFQAASRHLSTAKKG